MFFFYNHMKIRDQAQLCLAIYDLSLKLCLTFQRI